MPFPLHLKHYLIKGESFALFEPEKEMVSISYQKGEMAFPYWSQVWPAAIGLAQFLLQTPHYIVGKTVLELAAGIGLPSLIAVKKGAGAVRASDYAANAVAAIRQTIAYHQLQNMEASLLDWTALPKNLAADTLLLSDVSYDEKLFAVQEKVILSFLENGTTVLISTPQRLIAKQALQPLLPFCIRNEEVEVVYQQQPVAISFFVLRR